MLYTGAARLVSLLTAGALSVVLMLAPQTVAPAGQAPDHLTLVLCMWGIAAGFVHGVGFVPFKPLWRTVFGPVAAWGLMLAGTVLLAVG
jgi:predicted membrane protein